MNGVDALERRGFWGNGVTTRCASASPDHVVVSGAAQNHTSGAVQRRLHCCSPWKLGRVLARSAFAQEAVIAAVDEARRRASGPAEELTSADSP